MEKMSVFGDNKISLNDLGMREITSREAADLGIDLSMVGICKKIRKLAALDRLQLDESEHRSGLNRHLLNYIKYCGFQPIEYIKEYLAHIQPYMIERRKNQEKEKTFICVIDKMYRVSLYIKVDSTQHEELVISFHEDNKRGIAKTNRLIQNNSNHLVPVFAKNYGAIDKSTGNVSIDILITRGMKTLPIGIIGFKCEDVFIVREDDINRLLVNYCNEYIRDLYTSNLDLDFSQIEVFSMLQQISFTSYGRDTFSSISLLIDSLETQKDFISKQTADFALVTFTQSLLLTQEQKEELIDLLREKYQVTSIKSIDDILYRIEKALIG